MVPARITLATLGVANVERSRTFYRSLGWETAVDMDEFAVFRTAGSFLALYPIVDLAHDIGDDVPPGVARRTALAINVASLEEVDSAIAEALAAGGALLAAPARAEWGGYSGYFADPDGHAWEVAHNPGWPLGDDGLPRID
jgi:predicted lactoylglutathione lyase